MGSVGGTIHQCTRLVEPRHNVYQAPDSPYCNRVSVIFSLGMQANDDAWILLDAGFSDCARVTSLLRTLYRPAVEHAVSSSLCSLAFAQGCFDTYDTSMNSLLAGLLCRTHAPWPLLLLTMPCAFPTRLMHTHVYCNR